MINSLLNIEGFVKITDANTKEVLLDKKNAIHFENLSEALARSIANRSIGRIFAMAFGNGGTTVDASGNLAYLPSNTIGQAADLYNQTYQKVVDDNSAANVDPIRNKLTVVHTPGKLYTDIVVSCLLDFGEPLGQQAFDNGTDMDGEFVFDELGLKVIDDSLDNLKLITHVVFHPIQKSLNRQIQIDYTVRIQTLTALSSNV